MTWTFGADQDSNVTGSMAHHPVLSAAPAIAAIRPAFCGGITLATCAVCLPKSVISVLVDGSTEVTLPPCDSDTHSIMPGYSSFQAFWNRRCCGERILGVEDDQLRARLSGLQIMRDQAGALVRRRRTAIGRGGHRDHHQAAVLHGLELLSQQHDLLAGLPGMRHFLRGGFVVAGQRVEAQIDAGRQHQPVIGKRRAVGEGDRARLRIHLDRGLRDHRDAGRGDLVVAELLGLDARAVRR